jgi:hypothetical protein
MVLDKTNFIPYFSCLLFFDKTLKRIQNINSMYISVKKC